MKNKQQYVTKTVKQHTLIIRTVNDSDTITRVKVHLYGRIPTQEHKLIKMLEETLHCLIASIASIETKEYICAMPIETFFNESTKIEKTKEC